MQQDTATALRMLGILLNGVSTRRHGRVIPKMASMVGVSRSTVRREAAEVSEAALRQLLEPRFDDVDLLITSVDGAPFGGQCVLAAASVDVEGRKPVLAIREETTENADAAPGLLEHLVSHGVPPARRRFVRDRWLEGLTRRHRRGLRSRHTGASAFPASSRRRRPARCAQPGG